MDTNPLAEISACLKHKDYSLAVRRMLDLCLDIGDNNLLRESIAWSAGFNSTGQPHEPPEAFINKGHELMDRIGRIQNQPLPVSATLVEARGISMSYRQSNFALAPVNLQIQTGNIVGIVGENGNGKTTLLRCLAGQLAIDQGSIQYSALKKPDYYAIKNHVAFIPQRIPRWYGLLKDNLHFSAAISGVKGEQNMLMVDFMLERLNLTRFAHLTWNQISSGYRTRFELARILLQKPSLLILDEPLANLDINAQQTILTDLKYLIRSAYHPMGVLLSSQQLHEVEKVADTVLFIKQGKCLFKTSESAAETVVSYALEIESTASRESIVQVLGETNVLVQFNGGFYTITSAAYPPKQLLSMLIAADIPISYFRDITHSTKRFF